MAASGVNPADVLNLATGTEIKAPDNGDAGGFFLAKSSVVNGPLKWTAPDTVATPYELDLTTYTFDVTATDLDPVEIEIAFGDDNDEVEVVLSAADKTRFDADEITITGVSSAWTPAQSNGDPITPLFFQPVAIWRADLPDTLTVDGSGGIDEWKAVDGDGNILTGAAAISLVPVTGAKKPTYDAISKVVEFDGNGASGTTALANQSVFELSGASLNARVWSVVVAGLNNPGTASQHALFTPSSGHYHEGLRTGTADRSRWFDSGYSANVTHLWNGAVSGTLGSETPAYTTANRDQFYLGSSANTWPTNEGYSVLIDPSSTLTPTYFGAGDVSGSWSRGLNGKIGLITVWDEALTNPAWTMLYQGWQQWLAFNNGWTTDGTNPVLKLQASSPAHPYLGAAPGGGAAPTVTVTAPSLTITFSNIPEDAEVRIYDLENATLPDFGDELAGVEDLIGTSFEYSHSRPGELVMLQIFADGFKELTEPITLLSVSQNINAAELLEAEDAL